MDWLWWLGAAFAIGILEILILDVFGLMLVGGALVGALAAALGAPVPVQFVSAGVSSIALIFLLRPSLKRWIGKRAAQESFGVEGLRGRTAEAITELTTRGGQIKLAGEVWSARLADYTPSSLDKPIVSAGQDVVVVEIDGAVAVVAPRVQGTVSLNSQAQLPVKTIL